MEETVLVVVVLGVGYVLGVWTACAVFAQPQREYEDAAPTTSAAMSKVLVAIPGDLPRPLRRRP
ncbi:MAG TPA: hypothetical protein VMW11_06055 [Candidatus Dormibacteraeota bacterium]|nr:hypothetical protein [Candidatus Dormibacteraeota bacterium]